VPHHVEGRGEVRDPQEKLTQRKRRQTVRRIDEWCRNPPPVLLSACFCSNEETGVHSFSGFQSFSGKSSHEGFWMECNGSHYQCAATAEVALLVFIS